MTPTLPTPDLNAIAALVTGYVNGFERACTQYGLEVDALEALLLDANIEACPDCGWYVDCHELLDDHDTPDGHCDNCRPT